jgi:pantothenate kinase
MQRSPYIRFSREEWSRLRADTPLTLNEEDLADLQGINVSLSLTSICRSPGCSICTSARCRNCIR